MKGKINISIWNNRVRYELEFKRSITLITGKSSTGKSTLIKLMRDRVRNGKLSGIKMESSIEESRIHVILDNNDCDSVMSKEKENILYFADENVSLIKAKEFSEFLKRTGSWLVYVSRDDSIRYLNFSVHEIYEIKSVKKDKYYMHSLKEV